MNQSRLLDRVPHRAPMSVQSHRAPTWLSLTVIVVLLAVGSSSMMGPSARGADTPLAEFSAVRANSHVPEIARAYLYLASDEASFVHGASVLADGGMSRA